MACCSKCRAELEADALICPACGYDCATAPSSSSSDQHVRQSWLALLTFICGSLSGLLFTIPLAVLLGVAALAVISRRRGQLKGRGRALAGLTWAIGFGAGFYCMGLINVGAGLIVMLVGGVVGIVVLAKHPEDTPPTIIECAIIFLINAALFAVYAPGLISADGMTESKASTGVESREDEDVNPDQE